MKPAAASEMEMDALDLLTEDCWKEILKRVKAPEDLKSCSETCLLFEEILRKKKTAFMFSLILPNLCQYIAEDDETLVGLLMKFRLVCKSWGKAISELFDHCGDFFEDYYSFGIGEGIEQFLQTFATHAGNPFLGRAVILSIQSPLFIAWNQAEGRNAHGDPEQTLHLHIRKVRQLLERFGSEIWKVLLSLHTRNELENFALCKTLQTALTHLPNLRTLNVWCPTRFINNLNAELDQQQRKIAEDDLTTYIAANPSPALPHLQKLKATGLNAVMTRSILEKAPQVKSVVVPNPRGFPEQGRFSHLEKLDFSSVDANTPFYCLRQLRSPLRSLRLRVANNKDNVNIWAIDELFRNIQHLPIQDLRVSVWNVFWGEPGANVFLGESEAIPAASRPYHGSISYIEFGFPSGSASLNFLLYCPKLEYICMRRQAPREGIPAGHPNGVQELLDVNDMLEQAGFDFYQSNIWGNIPSLKYFILFNYIDQNPNGYRRVDYEKRKLENGGEAAGKLL